MNVNVKEDAKQTIQNELKLTDEELSHVSFFSKLSQQEKDELLETVYTLSMILYKNFEDENT